MARAARALHPGAWWLWALGLAASASTTTNPYLLLLLMAVCAFVVAMRHSDHAWSSAFRFYLVLAAAIVVIRVVFRIVFTIDMPGHVLFTLPEIPLPDWVAGIRLLGKVTRESVLAGLYDGLRLATLVVCIGAANSLANPKRMLASMPPALYEVGTALVVSVSVLPQLADSVRRVRAARKLRAVRGGRVGRLKGLVVPILEDALERSMALAAGMDSRGYGRTGNLSRGRRTVTGVLMLLGLSGICVGVYGLLDHTAPRWLAHPMLIGGVALAALGFASAGRRVRRTRYRPDRWRRAEIAVALSGIAVAVAFYSALGGVEDYPMMYPDVSTAPFVTTMALVAVLMGALPAVLAPPPELSMAAVSFEDEKEDHDDRVA